MQIHTDEKMIRSIKNAAISSPINFCQMFYDPNSDAAQHYKPNYYDMKRAEKKNKEQEQDDAQSMFELPTYRIQNFNQHEIGITQFEKNYDEINFQNNQELLENQKNERLTAERIPKMRALMTLLDADRKAGFKTVH